MQRAIGFIASLLLSPCVFAEAQVNAGLSIYWDQAALSFIDRPGSTGTVTLGDYSPFSYVYYDPAGAWTSTDPNATFSFPNGQSGLVSTDGSAGQPTMRDYAQVNGDNGWAGIQLGSTWTVNVTAPGTIWMRLPYTFTASVVGMQSWAQVTTSNLFETNFGSEPTNGDIDDHSWTASGSESRSGIFERYIDVDAPGTYTFAFVVDTSANITTAVPEPESWALLGIGAVALLARQRKHRADRAAQA
ncbi:hypothetical protein JCM19000A_06570 [Silvimonas sp. JCM 19000]